jgi:hypothetical protein
MHQINQYGSIGQPVTLSADDDYPEEFGHILWHSPEDPMLYIVLVVAPLNPTDHRHRLVAGDCMFTRG